MSNFTQYNYSLLLKEPTKYRHCGEFSRSGMAERSFCKSSESRIRSSRETRFSITISIHIYMIVHNLQLFTFYLSLFNNFLSFFTLYYKSLYCTILRLCYDNQRYIILKHNTSNNSSAPFIVLIVTFELREIKIELHSFFFPLCCRPPEKNNTTIERRLRLFAKHSVSILVSLIFESIRDTRDCYVIVSIFPIVRS